MEIEELKGTVKTVSDERDRHIATIAENSNNYSNLIKKNEEMQIEVDEAQRSLGLEHSQRLDWFDIYYKMRSENGELAAKYEKAISSWEADTSASGATTRQLEQVQEQLLASQQRLAKSNEDIEKVSTRELKAEAARETEKTEWQVRLKREADNTRCYKNKFEEDRETMIKLRQQLKANVQQLNEATNAKEISDNNAVIVQGSVATWMSRCQGELERAERFKGFNTDLAEQLAASPEEIKRTRAEMQAMKQRHRSQATRYNETFFTTCRTRMSPTWAPSMSLVWPSNA